MSRLAALVAAFLVHAAQPLGLVTLSTASLFAAQTRAKAQNLEAVQRLATTLSALRRSGSFGARSATKASSLLLPDGSLLQALA